LIVLVLILLPLSIAETKRVWLMVQPQSQPQPQPPIVIQSEMQRIGAYMAVAWRTESHAGISPREVLESTASRMQYEQTTAMGNDKNAQALIKVLESIAILEGRSTETADGFPIIE
jgi:hypothetical protein